MTRSDEPRAAHARLLRVNLFLEFRELAAQVVNRASVGVAFGAKIVVIRLEFLNGIRSRP